MWVKPGYNPPTPEPPPEQGKRLAEIPRGRDAVLRVNLQEYQGRPYLALRVWERGSDGQLWPCKGRGISVRISELAEVVAAMRQAEDLADRMTPEAPPDDRPRYVPRRGRPGPRVFSPDGMPGPACGKGERFDEFDGPAAAGGR